MRTYSKTTHRQDFKEFRGHHENELFCECTFHDIRGATFKDCNLRDSKFLIDDVRKIEGLTVTVGDCRTWEGLELSPQVFDLMLLMLVKTRGNTEKRRKLLEIVGHDRAYEILKRLETAYPAPNV